MSDRQTSNARRETDRQADAVKTEINDACCMTLCELTEHLQAADSSQLVCIMTSGIIFTLTGRGRPAGKSHSISISFYHMLYFIHDRRIS